MDKSLRSNTNELVGTKAIKRTMRSPAGSRTVWTIVEGEDDDLEQFICVNDLPQYSEYDICRGHDVVKLLSLAFVRHEYTYKTITNKIVDLYTYKDFQRTNLYSMIQSWGSKRDLEVLRKEIKL